MFADYLKEEKEKQGHSLVSLSERCGVSVSYISHLTTNRKKPSIETIEKLAEGLKIEVSELMQHVDFTPRNYIQKKTEEEKTFADYLREERLKLGMSSVEMAEKSGISQAYVLKIENKQIKKPSYEKIKSMADTLNLSFSALIEKGGYTPSPQRNRDYTEKQEEKIETPDLLVKKIDKIKVSNHLQDFILAQDQLGVKRTTIAKMAGIAKVYVNQILHRAKGI
jgi:transcriptional regulator with XRE-family HTH domain